ERMESLMQPWRPAPFALPAGAGWRTIRIVHSHELLREVLQDCSAKQVASELGLSLSDRKSTRLNSSHGSISYAVFCLKKKYQNLSAEDIGRIGSLTHFKQYPKEVLLIDGHEEGRECCVVIRGRARIFYIKQNGHEVSR